MKIDNNVQDICGLIISGGLSYLIWSGVVPQQPPTILTRPSLANDYQKKQSIIIEIILKIIHSIYSSVLVIS